MPERDIRRKYCATQGVYSNGASVYCATQGVDSNGASVYICTCGMLKYRSNQIVTMKFSNNCHLQMITNLITWLAIIDNYGVPISQWTWLYQLLLEVSMNKIALWINVCADDWTVERAIIASNIKLPETWKLI